MAPTSLRPSLDAQSTNYTSVVSLLLLPLLSILYSPPSRNHLPRYTRPPSSPPLPSPSRTLDIFYSYLIWNRLYLSKGSLNAPSHNLRWTLTPYHQTNCFPSPHHDTTYTNTPLPCPIRHRIDIHVFEIGRRMIPSEVGLGSRQRASVLASSSNKHLKLRRFCDGRGEGGAAVSLIRGYMICEGRAQERGRESGQGGAGVGETRRVEPDQLGCEGCDRGELQEYSRTGQGGRQRGERRVEED